MDIRKFSILLLLISLLSGCRLGPRHCVPEVAIPDDWHGLREESLFDERGELLALWELFDDPILSSHLKSLIYTNLDVRLAHAKVCEAFALRKIAAAGLFPIIDGRVNYYSSKPAGGRLASSQDTPSATTPLAGIPLNLKQQSFLADFDATWELDVFGRLRSEVESAAAFAQSEIANSCSIYITLLAEYGKTYLELRKAQLLSEKLGQELSLFNEKKVITQNRVELGLDNEQALLEVDAQIAGLKSELHATEAEILPAIYHLSVLGGNAPDLLVNDLTVLSQAPSMSEHIPIGVPSDLLRRRPDVRSAERSLAQATADVGVAVAELFPRIRIDGSYGFQNLHLGMAKGQGESWTYGGGLLTPIFHAGKLRSNVARFQWRRQQAWIQYESTVLQALEEAESAMVRLINSKKSADDRRVLLQNQRRLSTHTESLYRNGLANALDLLEVKQATLEAERSWIAQETDAGIQLIALYKALGGSWSCD